MVTVACGSRGIASGQLSAMSGLSEMSASEQACDGGIWETRIASFSPSRPDGANLDDAGVVGLVDAFEHSIEAGTSVATREPRLIRERTSLGETALHLLVLGSSPEAVRSILRLGAEVRALCDFGESPLSLAASLGKAEIVQTLLGAGAPVAIDGQPTPTLHKGVQSGNRQVVELLLDAGADVNEQSEFAEAPIHIAAEEGFAEIVQLRKGPGIPCAASAIQYHGDPSPSITTSGPFQSHVAWNRDSHTCFGW